MALEIKPIESRNEWDNFETKYAPHSFLQSWEWGEAQQTLGSKIYRLGIYKNNQLAGIAFVYEIKAKRGNFLFCPHGPLINWDDQKQFYALVDWLKNLAKKENLDFVRLSPLAKNSAEIKKLFITISFRSAPIHMMHPELAWLLNITASEEQLLANMEKRTRYSIKKAQKDGVIIKTSINPQDLAIFYQIYQTTAQRQSFVPFSEDYIKKEFEIFSKENKILLYLAEYNKEIIAAAMIIFTNNSGFYHHGASTKKYPHITAAELIQWQAICEAKNRGLKLYNFWGIAPATGKNHPWSGLTMFKKGFGGFSEEYLHAQDLPLNKKYWINYLVEKIRTIKRGY
ncbi:hypothetical protein CO116_03760 [Candidatus Falkowbacteria bacterium CG_4_9_14_3_um_filter_38_19]|uniref:Methicillin resistance protein n=2 Tax=Candidatus Falkowiibacteriota TaxID=1752728 RepID=A0A2M6WPD0_9BACT|nr:aminoacyltransferase [Candidatus Falkowbacteria bacterium]PIT94655.1 MAG: hypothetical protein COT96_03015 [Candidatus Falkowbacteria bacterium CG10_big_fil_rev_8_21_14_0_10_38_22]PJB15420.1 MAG: hypothetical protein CO116_03760 [Candidatus Falkowbacteria bacterium CG_4_9_14_3_um_filter_38_19]